MKRIILTSCLIASAMVSMAQMPKEGDHSFTFGTSGINVISPSTTHPTGTLLFRHYLKDDLALRVGVNFNNLSSKTSQMGYKGDSITASSSSSNWALSLGIQKNFKGTAKLEPYIGADLMLGMGSSSSKSTTVNSTLGFTTDVDTKNGSTGAFRFIPCVGFNYYFTNWLAIGAEFGWGFASSSTKAGTNTTTVTPTAGSAITTVSNTAKTSSAGFNTIGSGLITVTVAFNHK
ncbi:MAG: hypothetical protein RI955_1249 [Bacteroidota bacterium]|jgi:hypothetical protein